MGSQSLSAPLSPHTTLLPLVPLCGHSTCLAVARGCLRSELLFFPNRNYLTLRSSTVKKIERVTKHSALGQLLRSSFLSFSPNSPLPPFLPFLPFVPYGRLRAPRRVERSARPLATRHPPCLAWSLEVPPPRSVTRGASQPLSLSREAGAVQVSQASVLLW